MEILEILWNGLSETISGVWTGSGDILNIIGMKGKELTEIGKQALEILAK